MEAAKGIVIPLDGGPVHLRFLAHSGQMHDACTVPPIILQRKIQTNVESFTLSASENLSSTSSMCSE